MNISIKNRPLWTLAALLVAGTPLADAATATIETDYPDNTRFTTGGTYAGVSFSLSADWMRGYDESMDNLILDSIGILGRKDDSWTGDLASTKAVIRENGTDSFLAISDSLVRSSLVVGGATTYIATFSNFVNELGAHIELDAAKSYDVLFVSEATTLSTITARSFVTTTLAAWSNSVLSTSDTSVGFFSDYTTPHSTSYKAHVVVSTIPEPSAFGLLAAAGALALVAARRRRQKKA